MATFDRDARLRMAWSPGDGIDYVVENVFEALTEPGEWYCDRPKRKLYYIPVAGEDMSAADVIVPHLAQLMELNGSSNLRFEGLTFAHSEWTLPPDEAGAKQAAIHVPAAVTIRHADDCVFHGCTFTHLGSYGAEVLDESTETRFQHCTFNDLAGGGIRIWHGCRRNAVLDCDIGDGGHVFASAVGVLIGKATGNRVVHCHIHDFYYTGISVGWNWGYAESNGYGNVIEWNHIHDIGKGVLSDMGAIYLLGHATGTRLRYNHIHDVSCRRYGGWCIYTDEGSTNVLIESNLCYRANRTAFNQHYGRNNQVINNIFAYGGDAVISYGRPEEHVGLIFERNIFLSRDTPILRGATPDRWTTTQTVFERNLYWCEAGPVRFERGGINMYGTQAFPNGYKAAAGDFAALGDVPRVNGTPSESDWAKGRVINHFVTQSGTTDAPDGLAEFRFLLKNGTLMVRSTLQRPQDWEQNTSVPVWNREHIELFLKPFPDRPAMLQIGLASDDETAIQWHDCPAPPSFNMISEVHDRDSSWIATLCIPLNEIIAATGSDTATDWRFIAGFAVPAEVGDFQSWQKQGHDPEGIVADPKCAEPHAATMHMPAADSARKIGFVPFDIASAGPRARHETPFR